jgi:hypothetical protein
MEVFLGGGGQKNQQFIAAKLEHAPNTGPHAMVRLLARVT